MGAKVSTVSSQPYHLFQLSECVMIHASDIGYRVSCSVWQWWNHTKTTRRMLDLMTLTRAFWKIFQGISTIEKCFHWKYYRLVSTAAYSWKEKLQIHHCTTCLTKLKGLNSQISRPMSDILFELNVISLDTSLKTPNIQCHKNFSSVSRVTARGQTEKRTNTRRTNSSI